MVKRYQELPEIHQSPRTRRSVSETPKSLKSKTTPKKKLPLPRSTDKSINKPISKEKKKKQKRPKYFFVGPKLFKVSAKILQEIKKCQFSTENLIPKLPFSRLVHELMQEYFPGGRIQRLALQAIQEAVEAYVIQFLEDSYACALHARRCTLIVRDMVLIKHLRTPNI